MKRAPARLRPATCVVCQTGFETRHSQGKYCSDLCRQIGARKSWRSYGDRNRLARRLYQQTHYARNAPQIIARTAAYHRTPRGREVGKAKDQRQRIKHFEKYQARQTVMVALRSGKLHRQPCEICGQPKAQAHHPDYSAPLGVKWLCEPCHRAEHRRQPAASLPGRIQ